MKYRASPTRIAIAAAACVLAAGGAARAQDLVVRVVSDATGQPMPDGVAWPLVDSRLAAGVIVFPPPEARAATPLRAGDDGRISVPAARGSQTVLVGAGGCSWQILDLDPQRARSVTVRLHRAGVLRLQVARWNERDGLTLALRHLRRNERGAFELCASVELPRPGPDGSVSVADVPAGVNVVSLHRGAWWLDAGLLASAWVVVEPGRTATLDLVAAGGGPAGAFVATLTAPGWPTLRGRAVSLAGADAGNAGAILEGSVTSVTATADAPERHELRVEAPKPGAWWLEILEWQWRTRVEVGGGGASMAFALPEPAVVEADPVDEETGQRLAAPRLRWRVAPPAVDGSDAGSRDRLRWTWQGVSFLSAPGEAEYRCEVEGYDPAEGRARVASGAGAPLRIPMRRVDPKPLPGDGSLGAQVIHAVAAKMPVARGRTVADLLEYEDPAAGETQARFVGRAEFRLAELRSFLGRVADLDPRVRVVGFRFGDRNAASELWRPERVRVQELALPPGGAIAPKGAAIVFEHVACALDSIEKDGAARWIRGASATPSEVLISFRTPSRDLGERCVRALRALPGVADVTVEGVEERSDGFEVSLCSIGFRDP